MTIGKWLNFIFAVVGISSGLYLVYSAAIRTISRKIETEIGKMEKDILNKLGKKAI